MKIVCESCGAKYSIADEKVAGKVFKIRCKKCSAVIVVKGDQPEAGNDESTRVFDYGADAVWHVVVGGDQQGPLTPRQIGEMLADGRIDWEAYVWREGMDGWLPAKDVDALVSAVMAESDGGQPAAAKPAASGYGGGQVFGGSSDMGADPFAAGDDGGLSGVMAQSSGGGTDLFAQSSKSPFSGVSEDDDRKSNGTSPRISEGQAMTGQRNENSVLFSLSNLQALATGTSAPATSTPRKAGMAQGEGSGLIDIRALASASQAVSERPNGHSKERVEDLLAVGSVNTTFSASTLAAPVAQEKPDRSKFLMFGMGSAILALGAAVAYLAVREPAASATAVTNSPAPAAQVAMAPAAQAPAAAAPEGVASAERVEQKGAPKAQESDDEPERERERERERSGGARPKKAGGGDSRPAERTASAPSPEPAKPAQSSGDKSIDDLLDSALGGKPAKPAAKAAASATPSASLPQTPSRDDVISAMKSVAPRVSACGGGQSGVAMTKITVTGSTGRVTKVDVSGQFAGTPAASCIAREVGKAKFGKFQQSTFSVAYPFKI